MISAFASNLWDIKTGSVALGRLTDLWSFPSSSVSPSLCCSVSNLGICLPPHPIQLEMLGEVASVVFHTEKFLSGASP